MDELKGSKSETIRTGLLQGINIDRTGMNIGRANVPAMRPAELRKKRRAIDEARLPRMPRMSDFVPVTAMQLGLASETVATSGAPIPRRCIANLPNVG